MMRLAPGMGKSRRGFVKPAPSRVRRGLFCWTQFLSLPHRSPTFASPSAAAMPHVKDLVDRVSRALGTDADPSRVEAVVSSLLETAGPSSVLTGATLHVELTDCGSLLVKTVRARVYDKIRRIASHAASALSETGLGADLNIATTPLPQVAGRSTASDFVVLARMLDDAARDCSASEISGLTAGVERGVSSADGALISAVPEVLHATGRVLIDVRAGSPDAGVNVDAVMKVVAALRRFNGPRDDLLRLHLTGSSPARPLVADAALYLTADASTLIDEALRASLEAPVHDVSAVLTATAFALGRTAAQQGDAAAALLKARSGLEVRFGGIDVNPDVESDTHGVIRAAFAAAIADGFRAAVPEAAVRPVRMAAAFSRTTTDGAAGAWLAARLARSGRSAIAIHALFADQTAGEQLRLGPLYEIRVQEPDEPEWIRRGGQIPPLRTAI